MSKCAKPLLLLFLALLAIPLILLLVLNLALQSSAVRSRLQATIEKSVGMPITLGSISATPFGGIKVSEITAGTTGSTPHFTLDSIILYPCYSRLIEKEFVIYELTLNHPVVQVSLDDSRVTASQPSNLPTAIPQAGLTVTNTLQSPPMQNTGATAQIPTKVLLPPPSEKILRHLPRLTVTDAEFTLLNTQRLPIVSIDGMNLNGAQSSEGTWEGSLQAKEITVGKFLVIHDLQSPISLSTKSSGITLNDLTATLGRGKLGGNFSILLPPLVPEYKAQLTLAGASLNQFFLDASLGNAASEGVVTGDLQLSGIAGTPESMEGNGSLRCTDAVIQPADFLRQIGQILQIQELQVLRLPEGKAFFKVHQGAVQIDNISLRSENLILSAQGPVRSNGDLDFQARLLFNEKLTARLHGILGAQLTQAPEPGYTQISFHVSGPAASPKTDLLERLTGIRINGDLGGLLQGLFGHPR